MAINQWLSGTVCKHCHLHNQSICYLHGKGSDIVHIKSDEIHGVSTLVFCKCMHTFFGLSFQCTTATHFWLDINCIKEIYIRCNVSNFPWIFCKAFVVLMHWLLLQRWFKLDWSWINWFIIVKICLRLYILKISINFPSSLFYINHTKLHTFVDVLHSKEVTVVNELSF